MQSIVWYSKLPPEDEQLICSKHVQDIIGINLKRKCISFILITQIYHNAWFIKCQNIPYFKKSGNLFSR